jgi:hypothetical protein
MDPREMIPVPLNEWFFKEGELTELGYEAIIYAPQSEEIWKLMGLEINDDNILELLKKSMEYALLEDNILAFLFPTLGSVIFRLGVDNMMAAYSHYPNIGEFIAQTELSLNLDSDIEPYIFYSAAM